MKLYVFETNESYGSIPVGIFADSIEEAREILKKADEIEYDSDETQEFDIEKGKIMYFPSYIE